MTGLTGAVNKLAEASYFLDIFCLLGQFLIWVVQPFLGVSWASVLVNVLGSFPSVYHFLHIHVFLIIYTYYFIGILAHFLRIYKLLLMSFYLKYLLLSTHLYKTSEKKRMRRSVFLLKKKDRVSPENQMADL
ncbi:hypothetical protein ACJX0J_031506 [Zea mays]